MFERFFIIIIFDLTWDLPSFQTIFFLAQLPILLRVSQFLFMHKVFGAFLCILRVTFSYISQCVTVFLGQWVVHIFQSDILMGV